MADEPLNIRPLFAEAFGLICQVEGCNRKAAYAVGQDGKVICASHLIGLDDERRNAEQSRSRK